MKSRTFKTTLWKEGNLCAIRVPFDPKEVFGKVRAPVKVTLNGYTYRSTIASMGGQMLIPLRASHREAAGLEGDETLPVTLELDTGKREIKPPADLVKALKAAPPRGRTGSHSASRISVSTLKQSKKPRSPKRAPAGSQPPSR
jgi:hypothetical protein